MVDKVRIQDRITDNHLVKLIAKAGMSRNYVELLHDYAPRSRGKEHTPYARFYRDRQSGLHIMVTGLLPRINAAGFQIIPRWRTLGNKFVAEENCFEAEVEGGITRVTCINDQPTGAKKFDQLIWQPQIYLASIEQHCGNPVWLDTDPVNPHCHFNVLEWDYGICKRRLRIVEGRIRSRWVFVSNPNGEVRIKLNQSGAMKLRRNRYSVGENEEVIPAQVFNEAEYPFEIGDSPETFYPDAHPETSSVDGETEEYTGVAGTGVIWATIRGADGNGHQDVGTENLPCRIFADTVSERWREIRRGIYLFYTEGLPDDCIISAATISLRGLSKTDGVNITNDVNIYSSAPAANNDLVDGDYNSLGEIAYCDTPIIHANWDTAGYNEFAFNATGIAAISKTGVSKFGTRNATHDAANSPPTWASGDSAYFTCYSADQGNTIFDPKLVVTYTVPPPIIKPSSSIAAKMVAAGLI